MKILMLKIIMILCLADIFLMSRKQLFTALTSDAEDRVSLDYGHCSMDDSDKIILILFSSIEKSSPVSMSSKRPRI